MFEEKDGFSPGHRDQWESEKNYPCCLYKSYRYTWHGLRLINYQFLGKGKNNTILFLYKNKNVYFMLVINSRKWSKEKEILSLGLKQKVCIRNFVYYYRWRVWWPNVIIVKYVRFCEERIKHRKKQKNISDKNRKKVEK